MFYSISEIKKIFLSTIIFYLLPLFFISLYPPTENYLGNFQSIIAELINSKKLIFPNTTGIIFDLVIINLVSLLAYPKKTIHKDRMLQMFSWPGRLLSRGKIILNESEMVTLRLYLVKLFFVTIMFAFVFNILGEISSEYKTAMINFWLTENISLVYILPLILSALFLIDVSCFLLGYLTEAKKLNNIVISVDPTLSGWLVCLLCYPPFNFLTVSMFGYLYNIGAKQTTEEMTIYLTLLGLPFLYFYAKASVDLLFKASNLTYRGLVTHGTYSRIRHPAYVSKIIMWTIATIPFVFGNPWLIVTIFAWATIYILRALTEERHIMMVDPEAYLKYKKQVPYRFIPKIV